MKIGICFFVLYDQVEDMVENVIDADINLLGDGNNKKNKDIKLLTGDTVSKIPMIYWESMFISYNKLLPNQLFRKYTFKNYYNEHQWRINKGIKVDFGKSMFLHF